MWIYDDIEAITVGKPMTQRIVPENKKEEQDERCEGSVAQEVPEGGIRQIAQVHTHQPAYKHDRQRDGT